MNINDIEDRNIKQEPEKLIKQQPLSTSQKKDEIPIASEPGMCYNKCNENSTEVIKTERSRSDWTLIVRLSAALSACVGLIIGLIAGFMIGRLTAPDQKTEKEDSEELSIFSQYDYTQFVINESKNITIQDFYQNDEERYYAMNMIGSKIPDLKYLDAELNEHNINELETDKYIIEFFAPDCTYCNKMIDVVDEYRSLENSIPVIGLSIEDGDISKFNKISENSYKLINKDVETDNLISDVVWIPTFLYVENGTIKLVSFGLLTTDEITQNVEIAFETN